MYRVSFYRASASGELPRLECIATPSFVAASTVYLALKAAGLRARFWCKGGGLFR